MKLIDVGRSSCWIPMILVNDPHFDEADLIDEKKRIRNKQAGEALINKIKDDPEKDLVVKIEESEGVMELFGRGKYKVFELKTKLYEVEDDNNEN